MLINLWRGCHDKMNKNIGFVKVNSFNILLNLIYCINTVQCCMDLPGGIFVILLFDSL